MPNGDPVTKVEISGVGVGIRWGALGADMVPILEETSARLSQRYTVDEWSRLDPMEKALIIAEKRVHNAIQNIQSEAEMRKIKSEHKRK